MRKDLCTKTIFLTAIASIITVSAANFAFANPTSIGLGFGMTDSPYKGYKSNYYPTPHIDYDDNTFYIDDLSAGMYAYNSELQNVSIGVRYLPIEFKPHDSDNDHLKQLGRRHSTLLAEIGYELNTSVGNFVSKLSADILNNSNSVLADVDYNIPVREGNLTIIPKIGINWANSNHNDYYYGVSHKESARSGLRYHNANGSFNPYTELGLHYPLGSNFSTYGGVRLDKLMGDAKDSPMVEDSIVTSVNIGVAYTF
ncbi:MipA/OmpV family protein [Orbaceae bacterium ESL0727]|nr:MipA/OmpV family protein [Orbaceae bacterium ESL0727]